MKTQFRSANFRDRVSRNERLNTLYEEAGSRRAIFDKLAASKAIDKFALSLVFGRGQAHVSLKNGTEIEDEVRRPRSGITASDVNKGSEGQILGLEQGAVYGNKFVGDFVMPCGVCVIVGGENRGKTPIAHALAAFNQDDVSHQYAVVSVSESFAGYISDDTEAALNLAAAMVASPDVVLDSIKDAGGGGNEGAMTSGLSRGIFRNITSWAILAQATGSTIYVTLNPTDTKEAVIEAAAAMARSSATTVLWPGKSPYEWEILSRRGEGLLRVATTAKFKYVEGVAIVESIGKASVVEVSEPTETTSINTPDYKAPNPIINTTEGSGAVLKTKPGVLA